VKIVGKPPGDVMRTIGALIESDEVGIQG
jgi:hypothetical protein